MPNDTRALVIGGTSGIGKAVANRLRSFPQHRGMEVVVPEEARPEWSDTPLFELDVRDEDSIARYLTLHGRFDWVVYTPGINVLAHVEELSMLDMDEVMATNAYGFARVMGIHSALFGPPTSSVAIVSDAARNPMRGSLAYCASKAALAMMIRVIAREWTGKDARVNGVAPGVVEGTPLTAFNDSIIPDFRGWTPEEAREYERKNLPLGRRAWVDEVAAVVEAVLFGPLYQTGSIIDVTGGK